MSPPCYPSAPRPGKPENLRRRTSRVPSVTKIRFGYKHPPCQPLPPSSISPFSPFICLISAMLFNFRHPLSSPKITSPFPNLSCHPPESYAPPAISPFSRPSHPLHDWFSPLPALFPLFVLLCFPPPAPRFGFLCGLCGLCDSHLPSSRRLCPSVGNEAHEQSLARVLQDCLALEYDAGSRWIRKPTAVLVGDTR